MAESIIDIFKKRRKQIEDVEKEGQPIVKPKTNNKGLPKPKWWGKDTVDMTPEEYREYLEYDRKK